MALLLSAFALPVAAEKSQTFMLYDGSALWSAAADSTAAKSSHWFPVRGASRVVIRLLSAGAGAHTGADSQFVDSLAVVSYLFSDTVSFIARDSAGTVVTASSLIPTTSDHGPAYPICGDSVMVTATATNATVGDSAYKMVAIGWPPVLKRLRSASSGGGVYTIVAAAIPPGAAAPSIYGDGTIMPQYMKLRVTPAIRMTTAGFSSTAGIRTKGVRGLRGWATVYYRDKD